MRSSLCLWAVLGACEHVGAGLWLGLWAALWALEGGRLIGQASGTKKLGFWANDTRSETGTGKAKGAPNLLAGPQQEPNRLTVRYARRS